MVLPLPQERLCVLYPRVKAQIFGVLLRYYTRTWVSATLALRSVEVKRSKSQSDVHGLAFIGRLQRV